MRNTSGSRSATTSLAARLGFVAIAAVSFPPDVAAQARSYALESVAGLRPHNVSVTPVTHEGKRGVRVTISTTRGGASRGSRDSSLRSSSSP